MLLCSQPPLLNKQLVLANIANFGNKDLGMLFIAALRKELLISENTYEKVSNFNDDERVDIRDLVALAIHLSLES